MRLHLSDNYIGDEYIFKYLSYNKGNSHEEFIHKINPVKQ